MQQCGMERYKAENLGDLIALWYIASHEVHFDHQNSVMSLVIASHVECSLPFPPQMVDADEATTCSDTISNAVAVRVGAP